MNEKEKVEKELVIKAMIRTSLLNELGEVKYSTMDYM